MNLRFLGVGTAFSSPAHYHSNLLLTTHSGKRLLLDCGSDIRFSLAEQGLSAQFLDGVYISHLHADHIGGVEWLALSTYFARHPRRIPLLCEAEQLPRLWEHSLRGGLGCADAQALTLNDYFECVPLSVGKTFEWEGAPLELVRMPHVQGGKVDHPSFGLIIGHPGSAVFFTTDTQCAPEILLPIAERVQLIFHDCETSIDWSGVHARYEQLCTLPAAVRKKMWLYHYQPANYHPHHDGFLGFVTKGQTFVIEPTPT